MSSWPIRVIKIGGSLLDYPPLCDRFCNWLNRQSPSHNVLVTGGGTLANAIREADERFQLGEAVSHSLCIDVLSVTARLLHSILSRRWEMIAGIEDFRQTTDSSPDDLGSTPITRILDTGNFMRYEEAKEKEQPLPHRWDVTSDSIAARVAVMLGAFELVLLKSALPTGVTRQQVADEGYTDAFFPTASRKLTCIRAVNLRTNLYEETTLPT